VLTVASSAISVFQLIARMKLQVYWRRWLSERLAVRWLGDQRFYRLSIAAPDMDAPEALERCGLGHLAERLGDEDCWDKQLSSGEQQRIGFARLLIQRPDVVIMDEATAALDVVSQASMMELFRDELREATVISAGHRPELEEYHTRKLSLRRFAAEDDHVAEDSLHRLKLGRLLRRSLRPRASPDPASPVSR